MKTKTKSILFLSLVLISLSSILMTGCKKEEEAAKESCTDGIKNQDETGVDCGGACAACPTGVAAVTEMWFTEGGVVYKSAGTKCYYFDGTGFQVQGTFVGTKVQGIGIRIQTSSKTVALGTYDLKAVNFPSVPGTCSAFFQPDANGSKNTFNTTATYTGKLTITKYEATKISGTFNFTGLEHDENLKPVGTATKVITEGSFTDIAI